MTDDLRTPDGPSDPRWDALARYLAGEGDAADRARVQAELAADPAGASMVGALDDALRVPDPALPAPAAVERALAKVLAHRDAPPETGAPGADGDGTTPGVISLRSYRTRWRDARLRAAAAVLVVAGGALIWRAAARPTAGAADGRRYTTAVGAFDTLHLADGTRVILGPGSALTLTPDYGAPARTVVLRGQAQFDVRHDAARPFVVRAASVELRDVGTSFSVHADAAGGAQVVVVDGAVSVRGVGTATAGDTLRPGDRGTVSSSGEVRVARGAALPADLVWTSGRLTFRDASIREVATDLRRWYGIELVVTDSVLAQRRLTATFKGGTHDEVARVLAAALGGAPRLRGDTLMVDPIPDGPRTR